MAAEPSTSPVEATMPDERNAAGEPTPATPALPTVAHPTGPRPTVARPLGTRPPIELLGFPERAPRSVDLAIGAVEPSARIAQLDLDLVRALPAFPVEADWKDRARLWGHSFHPMCSYLASFPAALAHAFIDRYSRPGDVVLDPFAGRGTVPLQACVEGRLGVGNDLNPFAHILTAAKVDPPTVGEAAARLARLRIDWSFEGAAWEALGAELTGAAGRILDAGQPGTGGGGHASALRVAVPRAGSGAPAREGDEPVPLEVALAYHPHTLGELMFVRSRLDLADRTDRFLAAAVTGILHGRSRGYLSDLMPNTFSMAPRYVRDFARRTSFAGPERDVFACLAEKLGRLDRDGRPPVRGLALLGDARDAGPRMRAALRERALPDRARLVVTSPPYLRVLKYGYYNWLRAWFLGFDAAEIDRTLDDAHRRAPYLAFLRETLAGMLPALADDAVVVLVIGDVEADRGRRIGDGVGLADAVWEAARQTGGLSTGGDRAGPRRGTPQDDEAVGRGGRAGHQDRPHPGHGDVARRGRRRALAGAGIAGPLGRAARREAPLHSGHEADVPPRRPRLDGSARPHEEPRPRPDDEPPPQLRPAAAGPPLHARGEPAPRGDRHATSRPSARSKARCRGAQSAPESAAVERPAGSDRSPAPTSSRIAHHRQPTSSGRATRAAPPAARPRSRPPRRREAGSSRTG